MYTSALGLLAHFPPLGHFQAALGPRATLYGPWAAWKCPGAGKWPGSRGLRCTNIPFYTSYRAAGRRNAGRNGFQCIHYAAIGWRNGRFAPFTASEAASRPQIDIKWYYEGSTSDLGDLGPSVSRFPHRNTTLHCGGVRVLTPRASAYRFISNLELPN